MPNLVDDIPIAPISGAMQVSPIWLNWFNSVYRFLNKAPIVSSGIVAPTSTPQKVGDIYVDTVLGDVYIAVGTTNSGDWSLVN